MNQTSAIAGSLIIAFIVFITVRGELPCYLGVLGISNNSCNQLQKGGTSTGSGGSGPISNQQLLGNATSTLGLNTGGGGALSTLENGIAVAANPVCWFGIC